MTLPAYTSSREGKERQPGSGPKLCQVAFVLCIAPMNHHLSVTLESLHDQLPIVIAAVLQRKRRTTLTAMMKEEH